MKRPVLVACSLPVLLLTVTVGFTLKAKADFRAHPIVPVMHVYTGDVYQLRECGPGTAWFCPSYPGPVLPEDAPLWWCLTDGDERCGPAPVTVHDGVTCIRYTDGAVCQWPNGYRKAL